MARCGPWQAVAITSHLKGESISIAGACIRFGRAGSGSDFDTDQSRSVYLVRLISIWYCNWFMLFMSLDMPDESEARRALAEDDNSEECAILCESGARPGGYGLLVKCCAMSLFERS